MFHDSKISYIFSFDIQHFGYQSLIISIMWYYSLYGSLSLSNQNQVIPRRAVNKFIQCACRKCGTHAQVFSQAPMYGTASWHESDQRKKASRMSKNMKRVYKTK